MGRRTSFPAQGGKPAQDQGGGAKAFRRARLSRHPSPGYRARGKSGARHVLFLLFYLYYSDKRACFLAFVDDARRELDVHLSAVRIPGQSLEQWIGATLHAIYDYSDCHPGVLRAAMTDESVIDAEGVQAMPLLVRWGMEWADMVRDAALAGSACNNYDPDIIGQAIVGALHQAGRESARGKLCRDMVVDNLTRFLVRALKPD